jgi:hypothetical protein
MFTFTQTASADGHEPLEITVTTSTHEEAKVAARARYAEQTGATGQIDLAIQSVVSAEDPAVLKRVNSPVYGRGVVYRDQPGATVYEGGVQIWDGEGE